MAWTEITCPQFQQWNQDTQNVHIIQHPALERPTTIIQQLSAAMSLPTSPIQQGHVKQDLVELIMIQNSQMHQVIMNNMTMSALSSTDYSQNQPDPTPEASRIPEIFQQEEEVEEVYHYHYHYQPATAYLPYPAWVPPPQLHPSLVYHNAPEPPEPAHSAPRRDIIRRAVQPPPSSSTAGTVGPVIQEGRPTSAPVQR